MDDDFFFDKCHGSWVGKVTGSTYGMPFEGKNPRWLAKTYKQVAGWQKRHGAGGGVINDDEQFELGATLADASGSVPLNHPHCAKFCVLGGAACSRS